MKIYNNVTYYNNSVSMRDTVNPKDIFQDVVHNFSSRYRGYAQYHNVQVI